MKVTKDGKTLVINNKVQLAAFINSGWVEVANAAKPADDKTKEKNPEK
jgi:hypothetical protein